MSTTKSVANTCTQQRAVLDYRAHDDYENFEAYPYSKNDVALLKIEPAPTDCTYTPGKILKNLDVLKKGYSIQAAGFGPSITHPAADYRLRLVEAKIASDSTKTPEIEIEWATDTGLNSGDSGGPATVVIDDETFLVGVSSTGTVYMSIGAFFDWFQVKAKEMNVSDVF